MCFYFLLQLGTDGLVAGMEGWMDKETLTKGCSNVVMMECRVLMKKKKKSGKHYVRVVVVVVVLDRFAYR